MVESLTIARLGHRGDGVAETAEGPVFVPYALPGEVVEVEGSGSVTLVDPSEVSFSSIGVVEDGQPACMLGLRLHMLVTGATFNLKTRVANATALTQPIARPHSVAPR